MGNHSARRYDPLFLPLFLLRILSLTNRLFSLCKRDMSFCLRLTLSLDMAFFSVRPAMRFSTRPQRLQIRPGILFSTSLPFILPQYLPVLHCLLDRRRLVPWSFCRTGISSAPASLRIKALTALFL
jgi:hypothetical protein